MRTVGHRARWAGQDWRATPEQRGDGLWVWLVADRPHPGFLALTEEGPWVHEVPAAACDAVLLVRLTGVWRGTDVLVVDERPDDLLVESRSGSVLEARAAGFERVARGVHRRWVPRDELRGLREEQTRVDG
ncbi:hypothetical protein [Klenkia brasiliensis]|uniref:Uncharacterized protein n=1 Tax=Klenkia brasiliensis TaxID=333142 RepID=A0A1G7QGQ2_9ACTN|nr:hypothetical protein [Klenkia brasiliensis]SDF97645.1 hypothetical protein SAMN05660324_1477 [Klenkia brasiliensis]